ncbi:transcriptional regulator, IclR family [Oscillibacter sp. PC13]|nr:transcriptional regulator, IclR family [Oscillibacter sp. PC13]
MTQEQRKNGIQVQSVARAAEIIRCFERTPEMGISELAAEMGLNKSTVFGLVNTLASYGYLEQVESSKKYRLGIMLFELGNLVLSRIDVRNEAKECCAPLAAKYLATVHIATHSEGEVLYIDKLDRGNSLISTSNVGMRAPMYCTGVGKAMLAFLPEEYLNKYIWNQMFQKRTEHTITRKDALRKELDEVRRTGIAMDREEIERGVTCIASPVLRHTGDAELAVSLSFAYGRVQDVDVEEVKRDLLACTDKLSARLGYYKK